MPFRVVLLWVSCLAFLASNALGLHSHLSGDHGHGVHVSSLVDDEADHDVFLTSEYSGAQAAEHITRGDIDVDAPIALISKAPQLPVTVLFLCLCFVVIRIPLRRLEVVPFAEPPLRPPRLLHLLPPSQAPPKAA